MSEPFPSAAPPIVEIEKRTLHFDTKAAIHELSLTIPRGGVFGLILFVAANHHVVFAKGKMEWFQHGKVYLF